VLAKRKCGFAHAATVTYSCNICDFSDCNVVSIGYVAVFSNYSYTDQNTEHYQPQPCLFIAVVLTFSLVIM